MIDLTHNRIKRGDVDEPILRWTTWFKTPWGYCDSYVEAFKALDEVENIDKNLAMKPIAVAVSATTFEPYDP